MKIVTWNVNSIRMRAKHVVEWIRQNECDVLLLQELKCSDDKFPYEEFEDLNFNIEVYGQPGYNGVAILSKDPLEIISKGIPRFQHKDARYIECYTSGITIANVYVPNGGDVGSEKFKFKQIFFEELRHYLSQRIIEEDHFVIGGDFNVAIEDIDVYDPELLKNTTCFTQVERLALNGLMNIGLTDALRLTTQDQFFTWWDYQGGSFQKNKGMRIDYIFISPCLVKSHKKTSIDKTPRGQERSSDHVPVICEIGL